MSGDDEDDGDGDDDATLDADFCDLGDRYGMWQE